MGQDSEYSSKGASEIHLGGQADDGPGFVIIASHTHCIASHRISFTAAKSQTEYRIHSLTQTHIGPDTEDKLVRRNSGSISIHSDPARPPHRSIPRRHPPQSPHRIVRMLVAC